MTAVIVLSVVVLLLAIAVGFLAKFLWELRTDLRVLVEESGATRADLADALETKEAELEDAHASIEMVLEAPAPAPEPPPTNEEREAFEARIQDLESQLQAAHSNLELVLDNKSPKEGS